MTAILVTGGAGYIGSHMVQMLRDHHFKVVVLDNLSTGHQEAVFDTELVQGSTGDTKSLEKIFIEHKIAAVMHFSAYIEVGESVTNPAKYYQNNVCHTQTLLDKMLQHKINKFIFSSSAAIFGEPQTKLINETHPVRPINAYGKSKWMVEQILEDYDKAYGLQAVSLRYFNAAGADPQGHLGERHHPETHLIPLVLQAASGRRPAISIFGTDYDTPDGTCVRDYIHVSDLCDAHMLALQHLLDGGKSDRYNLGNGNGFSVKEVISCAKKLPAKTL